MDIGSGSGYPAANLSNFHPHQFTIDDIECASMEGFLQSLKFKDPNMQIRSVNLLVKKLNSKVKRKNGGKAKPFTGKVKLSNETQLNIKNY